MEADPMDVLLVSPFAADSDPNARVFASAEPSSMRFTRAHDLGEAVESLHAGRFDAVLLDLDANRREGLRAFVRLRTEASTLPIVVLASGEKEALALKTVQLGAQDYLLKSELHVTLLTRCVRHAIEQFRLVDELERRAQDWDAGRRPGETPATARIYGSSPLRELLPGVFDELVATYTAILTDAVEERGYRVSHDVPARLHALAEELGFLRAGPRDVVELHTAALRTRAAQTSARRLEAHVVEGRLLIVELMGNLASFYRRYSVAPRPAPRFGPAPAQLPTTQERGA